MPDTYRRHALSEAPIEDVWSIASDPRTLPDRWPELSDVRVPGGPGEGGRYTRVTRRLGLLDLVDTAGAHHEAP